MTIAVLMLLTAPLQLQTAYADLISASPENIVTTSGSKFHFSFWLDHSHFDDCHATLFECNILGIGFIEHHIGHCHRGSNSAIITSSHLVNNYNLDVKSLKDHNINVASVSGIGDIDLTTIDADATTETILSFGDNIISPVMKGISTIFVDAVGLETAVKNNLNSHFHITGSPFDNGHSHGSCPNHTAFDTQTVDFTYTITQANAGGPKPRLAQDSDENLLGFSTITQLIDIPAKGSELIVDVPGATISCEVFDQHGALRGACGTHALSSGDYSGFWSIVADGAVTTTISASVDGTPLELLTEVTK